jgi:hypothetical protein
MYICWHPWCLKRRNSTMMKERRHVHYSVNLQISTDWLRGPKSFLRSHRNYHISWNMKVYCHVHENPPLVSILSHMNTVHILTPYLIKIHLNIIFQAMFTSYKWPLSFRLSIKPSTHTSHLPHACHMPFPSHHPWFDNPKNIWRKSTNHEAPRYAPLTNLLLPPSSWDQHFCSHPVLRRQSKLFNQHERTSFTSIQNTGKVIVLYVLSLYTFRQKTQRQNDPELNGSKHSPNFTDS